MRQLLVSVLVIIPFLVQAQDDSYTMFETVLLTPDGNNPAQLRDAMKAHNANFHNDGVHAAAVWLISSGPNAGKMVWAMGPLKYADLDSRPQGDDHDSDWAKVMANIQDVGTVEYWKRDDELSNVVGDPTPMLYVRYWEVNSKYGFLVDGLLQQISETIKAMEGENPWAVWDNQMRQGNLGRHMATVSGMKNWAEMDDDLQFQATFKKVHGENSWIPFIRSMQIAFSNSWDEVWTLAPEMGGSE